MADTPSSVVKQSFITALRQTPAGIAGFLTTAIPTPPTCSVPTDVDAAIIANGVCAAYVLDLFRPFAGVTPVELLLRIGQHNSVMESALLAGLQYLADSQAAPDFAIIAPEGGRVYYPGEVRIVAQALNETVFVRMTGTLGGTAFTLKADAGVWRQYVTVTESGEYTLTVTATPAHGDPLEKSITVTISTEPVDPENPEDPPLEPEPPEGQDEEALSDAEDAFDQALKDFLATVNQNPGVDILLPQLQQMTNAYNVLTQITAAVESGAVSQAILDGAQAAFGEIQGLIAQVEESGVVDQISAKAGEVAGSVKAALSNLWGQLNG